MNNHFLPFKKKFAADVESIAVFSITAVLKKTKPRVKYSKRYICSSAAEVLRPIY